MFVFGAIVLILALQKNIPGSAISQRRVDRRHGLRRRKRRGHRDPVASSIGSRRRSCSIHGGTDDDNGTFPIRLERICAALKGQWRDRYVEPKQAGLTSWRISGGD